MGKDAIRGLQKVLPQGGSISLVGTIESTVDINIATTQITLPVDLQARLTDQVWMGTHIASTVSGTVTLGTIDMTNYKYMTAIVHCEQALDVFLDVSYDGTTWYPLAGASIPSTEFKTGEANNITPVGNYKWLALRVIYPAGTYDINAWVVMKP